MLRGERDNARGGVRCARDRYMERTVESNTKIMTPTKNQLALALSVQNQGYGAQLLVPVTAQATAAIIYTDESEWLTASELIAFACSSEVTLLEVSITNQMDLPTALRSKVAIPVMFMQSESTQRMAMLMQVNEAQPGRVKLVPKEGEPCLLSQALACLDPDVRERFELAGLPSPKDVNETWRVPSIDDSELPQRCDAVKGQPHWGAPTVACHNGEQALIISGDRKRTAVVKVKNLEFESVGRLSAGLDGFVKRGGKPRTKSEPHQDAITSEELAKWL